MTKAGGPGDPAGDAAPSGVTERAPGGDIAADEAPADDVDEMTAADGSITSFRCGDDSRDAGRSIPSSDICKQETPLLLTSTSIYIKKPKLI